MPKRTAPKPPPPTLGDNLVLFRYMLHQFGMTQLADVKKLFSEFSEDDWIEALRLKVKNEYLKDRLYDYDRNIKTYTRDYINKGRRDNPVRWKYFQYISLLFIEMYLDWYLDDADKLVDDLNKYRQILKREKELTFDVGDIALSDMNKLAIWQATGSGKTLLMHMHILMVNHYLKKYKKRDRFNKFILITPNERLSAQHLAEFELSGISAEMFGKNRDFYGELGVEVIEITKIRESSGKKTIAVEAFENNNIVLIDEAHRGNTGKRNADDERVWKEMRDTVYAKGFAFEYSATFGQAITSKDPDLFNEYAKTTLFDYSYQYFYEDGYGKDFNVMNIRTDGKNINDDVEFNYFIASLLAFYQQMRVYLDIQNHVRDYGFERPLMMLIGAKVIQSDTGDISDIAKIVTYIRNIIENRRDVIGRIEAILAGGEASGLINLAINFDYIQDIDAQVIYEDIRKEIFNVKSYGERLVIEDLTSAEGEISLRVGDDNFAVINIGNKDKFAKQCEQNGLAVSKHPTKSSLFDTINQRDSRIHILIGAKKFNEGWNSWRVSTMGLMKVGQGQGSQIIQLFGRGVRLRGYNGSLKRSSMLEGDERPPSRIPHIEKIETLNIFGVKSNYLKEFEGFLKAEGLPTYIHEIIRVDLPTQDELASLGLKFFGRKAGIPSFRQSVVVDTRNPIMFKTPIQLNLYAKVEGIQFGQTKVDINDDRHHQFLTKAHTQFVDKQYILSELLRFKRNQRADGEWWSNLKIDVDSLLGYLVPPEKTEKWWYQLYAPSSLLEVGYEDEPFDKVRIWEQDIILPLLKKYLTKCYQHLREEYENQYRIYVDLTLDNPNFIPKYQVKVEYTNNGDTTINVKEIQDEIEKYLKALEDEANSRFPKKDGLQLLISPQHLYKPLAYIQRGTIKISPPPLNDGEYNFVKGLFEYCRLNPNNDVFLLRNQSRGVGLGFAEANNFYPDFVLWVLWQGKQYISFIDPKGIIISDSGMQNPKIQFHKTIKEISERMGDDDVILNSFIVTETHHSEISHWKGADTVEQCREQHLLFMDVQDKSKVFDDMFRLILDEPTS